MKFPSLGDEAFARSVEQRRPTNEQKLMPPLSPLTDACALSRLSHLASSHTCRQLSADFSEHLNTRPRWPGKWYSLFSRHRRYAVLVLIA